MDPLDDEVKLGRGGYRYGHYTFSSLFIDNDEYVPKRLITVSHHSIILFYGTDATIESNRNDMVVKIDKGYFNGAHNLVSDDFIAHKLLTRHRIPCDYTLSRVLLVSTEEQQIYFQLEYVDGNIPHLLTDGLTTSERKYQLHIVAYILRRVRRILACTLRSGLFYDYLTPTDILYSYEGKGPNGINFLSIKLGDIGNIRVLRENAFDIIDTTCCIQENCRQSTIPFAGKRLSFMLGCTLAQMLNIQTEHLLAGFLESLGSDSAHDTWSQNVHEVCSDIEHTLSPLGSRFAKDCANLLRGRSIHDSFAYINDNMPIELQL